MAITFLQEKLTTFANGSARTPRPVNDVARFHVEAGTIQEIDIWSDFPVGSARFTMRKNGVDMFPVLVDTILVDGDPGHGEKTGLSITVADGDVISFDLILQSSLGAVAPLYFRIKMVGGTAGVAAQTVVYTTASLADDAEESSLDVPIANGFAVMQISVDRMSRVRLYANAAARTADAARAPGTAPAGEHSVITDIVFDDAGNLTWNMSPPPLGFCLEASRDSNIPIAVQNLSGSTHTVAVTIKFIALES